MGFQMGGLQQSGGENLGECWVSGGMTKARGIRDEGDEGELGGTERGTRDERRGTRGPRDGAWDEGKPAQATIISSFSGDVGRLLAPGGESSVGQLRGFARTSQRDH